MTRCRHRHTIDEHPGCFANNNILEKDYIKETGQPWYTYPGYKIGYLDIETSTLSADNGYILTWCIKEKGGKVFSDCIQKEDIFNYEFDKKVVSSLVEKLSDYKIIVTYYGTNFDIPFIRTRALKWGLEFPAYGSIYTWDLYYTVKSKLSLSRNSLDRACSLLGIKGKTHLDLDVWALATLGDEKALKKVLTHNRFDVIILEKLHDRLSFSRKWIKTSI
ncbi:MAG: ribonuclease H-like domain-containing protein [Candidatus Micrarchaeia archaeon]